MSLSRLAFDISLAGRAPAKPARTMHACNTRQPKSEFPKRARVSHHSGAGRSAFDHDWTQIEGAAPLRQDSRVPRLSTYPRASVLGYSQRRRSQISAPVVVSVQPALVAQPHHLVDEHLLLLVVEARKQRIGGIGHVALVDGAVV